MAAGLLAPQMHYESPISSGVNQVSYDIMAETIRAILPILLSLKVATEEEIGVEALAERLRQEVTSSGGMIRTRAVVSVWARTAH